MKQQKGFKYAYVAGLVDGEGCISVAKNNGGHSLSVTINQNDGRILDYCEGVFGGTIYKSIDCRTKAVIYKWVLPNEKASYMLKKIKPFLTRKKIEAEVAIAFEIRKRKYLAKWRKSFGVKGIKGAQVKPQPKYMIDYKEEQYLKLRELKKDLRPPRAGVTTKQVHSLH